jgi:mannan endo-1,4-beta-mannosidase
LKEIARHIKSLDSHHLVVDGSDGVFDSDGDDIEGLDVDAVDVISDHLYRASPTKNF